MTQAAHRPRRRFGQNFLRDRSVLQRIVAAIAPQPGDRLLEIGPGEGALTALLLERGVQLTALELDRDLVALLRARFDSPHFTLVQGDALELKLLELTKANAPFRIVGNLPYNISTPLLFHLLAQRELIADMHFLLQREVVQRLAAAPSTGSYGRLSVMTQYLCDVEPLFEVGPAAFRPAPKVVSQLVRLRPRLADGPEAVAPERLSRVLRVAFSQRRKTLRKALKNCFDAQQLQALDIDPGRRPDTLSVTEYLRLARALESGGEY